MATSILTYLLSEAQVRLSPTPVDYNAEYMNGFASRESGTIMPPSPGVQYYVLRYEMGGDSLAYNVKVKWHPVVEWLVKNTESWQMWHRSGDIPIAVNRFCIKERQTQLAQIREWKPFYEKWRLKKSTSFEMYQMMIEKTIKYTKLNHDWIQTYIKDHESSSLGKGFKWHAARVIDRQGWEQLYNIQMDNLEKLYHNVGWYNAAFFNSGVRARRNSLDNLSDSYSGIIDRTRIIHFHPSMSIGTAFIPQKAAWYEEILKEVEVLVKASTVFHYPYTLGGKIYRKAQELFTKYGNKWIARDGKKWEASIGQILGDGYNGDMMYTDGVTQLPSGETRTGMDGTICNICMNANTGGEVILLGDDMNCFGYRNLPRVPFIEDQPEDTADRYILGVSYGHKDTGPVGPTLEMPAVIGLRSAIDRAKKAIPLNLPDVLPIGEQAVFKKSAETITETWIGLYKGRFGEKSLLEAIDKLPPGMDYFSPHEVMEDLHVPPSRPGELAAELGFKTYVIA